MSKVYFIFLLVLFMFHKKMFALGDQSWDLVLSYSAEKLLHRTFDLTQLRSHPTFASNVLWNYSTFISLELTERNWQILRFEICQLSVHYFTFILHPEVIAFRGALKIFPNHCFIFIRYNFFSLNYNYLILQYVYEIMLE